MLLESISKEYAVSPEVVIQAEEPVAVLDRLVQLIRAVEVTARDAEIGDASIDARRLDALDGPVTSQSSYWSVRSSETERSLKPGRTNPRSGGSDLGRVRSRLVVLEEGVVVFAVWVHVVAVGAIGTRAALTQTAFAGTAIVTELHSTDDPGGGRSDGPDRRSQHPSQRAIGDVVLAAMEDLGGFEYDDEASSFAEELRETFKEDTVRSQLSDLLPEVREEALEHDLYTQPLPPSDQGEVRSASTDVGEVSRLAPLALCWTATWPVGTPAHYWQAVAANGSFAVEGMVYAAKVLADTAARLLSNPATLKTAKTSSNTKLGTDPMSRRSRRRQRRRSR